MNQSDWYSVYTAALLELNPTKLPTLIHDAETAIFSRIQTLAEDADSIRERETSAAADERIGTCPEGDICLVLRAIKLRLKRVGF
jgi:hypothetical protein